jgi:hypothetical protein
LRGEVVCLTGKEEPAEATLLPAEGLTNNAVEDITPLIAVANPWLNLWCVAD